MARIRAPLTALPSLPAPLLLLLFSALLTGHCARLSKAARAQGVSGDLSSHLGTGDAEELLEHRRLDEGSGDGPLWGSPSTGRGDGGGSSGEGSAAGDADGDEGAGNLWTDFDGDEGGSGNGTSSGNSNATDDDGDGDGSGWGSGGVWNSSSWGGNGTGGWWNRGNWTDDGANSTQGGDSWWPGGRGNSTSGGGWWNTGNWTGEGGNSSDDGWHGGIWNGSASGNSSGGGWWEPGYWNGTGVPDCGNGTNSTNGTGGWYWNSTSAAVGEGEACSDGFWGPRVPCKEGLFCNAGANDTVANLLGGNWSSIANGTCQKRGAYGAVCFNFSLSTDLGLAWSAAPCKTNLTCLIFDPPLTNNSLYGSVQVKASTSNDSSAPSSTLLYNLTGYCAMPSDVPAANTSQGSGSLGGGCHVGGPEAPSLCDKGLTCILNHTSIVTLGNSTSYGVCGNASGVVAALTTKPSLATSSSGSTSPPPPKAATVKQLQGSIAVGAIGLLLLAFI